MSGDFDIEGVRERQKKRRTEPVYDAGDVSDIHYYAEVDLDLALKRIEVQNATISDLCTTFCLACRFHVGPIKVAHNFLNGEIIHAELRP